MQIFQKLKEWRSRRRFLPVTRWRNELADHESQFLILEFKGRLESMRDFFQRMSNLCNQALQNQTFVNAAQALVNPNSLPMPAGQIPVATQYCNEVRTMIQTNFIDRIDVCIQAFDRTTDLRTFRIAINQLQLICDAALQNKTLLFYMSLRPYVVATNTQTGTVVAAPPQQLSFILGPFEILSDQLVKIAEGTAGTIQSWHKLEMEWKKEYLSHSTATAGLKSNRWVFAINIATVVVAVAVSAFFLTATDPFNHAKQNIELRNEVSAKNTELDNKNQQLENAQQEIDRCNQRLRSAQREMK